MKRIILAVLALTLLVLAALPVQAAIPNRYLGDRALPIAATASATAAAITVPAGHQGVYLLVINDGTSNVWVTWNETGALGRGMLLKPNEVLELPVAVTSLGYICAATETTLLRGVISYY